MRKRWIVLSGIATMAMISGCGGGGGGSSSQPGQFALQFRWPAKGVPATRVIPSLTQSIVVKITGANVNTQQEFDRPTGTSAVTTTANFANLPVSSSLVVQVSAFSSTGGSGTLLGIAIVPVTLSRGEDNTVTVDLQSSIDHLEFTGPNVSGGTLDMSSVSSTNVTITAFSDTHTVVPMAVGNLSASATAGFSTTLAGNVATVQKLTGTTGTLTATELESGKTATLHINGQVL